MPEIVKPVSIARPVVDAAHPWLGLNAYTEETQAYFFGRDAEIREIFTRVRENPLTILFGQSGLGKSSLLGAGLVPKLKVERFHPVILRLNFSKDAPSLAAQTRAALHRALGQLIAEQTSLPAAAGGVPAAETPGPESPVSRPAGTAVLPHGDDGSGASLWEILHHLPSRPAGLREHPPVLIFDQFEEIFTQEAQVNKQVAEWFTQISDLIENRPPVALQERFRGNRALAREFDPAPAPARVVLALREDYLSHLERWKDVMPSLMRNRMELKLLTGPQALEAVVRAGGRGKHPIVSEAVGAQIVRKVARRPESTPLEQIETVPPFLSLLCEQLNASRLQTRPVLEQITPELVAARGDDILDAYYEECFRNQPAAVRFFVEDRLVSGGGHRQTVTVEDAITELRAVRVADPATAIDALIARRLLTATERGGLPWLELTHDVLAPLVLRSRTARREQEREWRSKNERAVRLAGRLNLGEEVWRSTDRKGRKALLLNRVSLCQANELLERFPQLLTPGAREYISESQQAARRWRLPWLLAAIAVALALILCCVASDIKEGFSSLLLFAGVGCLLFAVYFLMPYLDRLPRQFRPKTFYWSAWRWTCHTWSFALIVCYIFSEIETSDSPLEYFVIVLIWTILSCPLLLVPFFKWGKYRQVLRESVQPVPQKSRAPMVALALTGAWPVITICGLSLVYLVLVGPTNPEKSEVATNATEVSTNGPEVSTSFETNADWIVKTVTRSDAATAEVTYLGPALAACRETVELMGKLAVQDPTNAQWQLGLSVNLGRLGDVQRGQGDALAALVSYQEEVEVARRLATQNPANAQRTHELVVALDSVSAVQEDRGNPAGALASYREAREMALGLVGRDPGNAQWQRDLETASENVARLAGPRGNQAEALDCYRTLAGIRLKSVENARAQTQTNAESKQTLVLELTGLAWYRELCGDASGALAASAEAVTLSPTEGADNLTLNHAHALMFNGQYEQAREIYLKYKGQEDENGDKWEVSVLKDFKDFREAGQARPDMEKIEELLLLADNADVNAKANDGRTALHWAAQYNDPDLAKALLDKEADVNARDNAGLTPLLTATIYESREVVELLLAHKADVNAVDDEGFTALHNASGYDQKEMAEHLLANGANVNARATNGVTPLYSAACKGHGQVVELLLAGGADVNAQDNDGWTALFAAADYGSGEVVGLLLAHKADVNVASNDGFTPLHEAAGNGAEKVVELLLAHGANVNARAANGATPLYSAARYGHEQVAELLLAGGADVNAKNNDGLAPLYCAAYEDDQNMVEVLLARGADVNAKTDAGLTALQIAKPQVADLLRAHGAND